MKARDDVETSILFVCLGNICRSPLAESVMKKMVAEAGWEGRFLIDSAGLIDYHEGELADPRMRRHAERHGYRITHRSRPISRADFQRFDLIIGMDDANMRALRSLAPPGTAGRLHLITEFFIEHTGAASVPDPYYGDDEGFELSIVLLEDACRGLLRCLTRSSS